MGRYLLFLYVGFSLLSPLNLTQQNVASENRSQHLWASQPNVYSGERERASESMLHKLFTLHLRGWWNESLWTSSLFCLMQPDLIYNASCIPARLLLCSSREHLHLAFSSLAIKLKVFPPAVQFSLPAFELPQTLLLFKPSRPGQRGRECNEKKKKAFYAFFHCPLCV